MATRPTTAHFNSTGSTSSSSSSSTISHSPSPERGDPLRSSLDTSPVVSIEVLRCFRCAKCVETTTTDDLASAGMVQVGTNLYYCCSCAKRTGFV